jgi:cysteine sulfinate desulfinase/cysteine desulfurase-like protein
MNELSRWLITNGVRHSIRKGVLRFSVGVYNDDTDIDRTLDLTRRWLES